MLAVAAVSAKLRAILLYKMCKIYNFCAALLIPHMTANSAHAGQSCAKFCTCRIAEFWHP